MNSIELKSFVETSPWEMTEKEWASYDAQTKESVESRIEAAKRVGSWLPVLGSMAVCAPIIMGVCWVADYNPDYVIGGILLGAIELATTVTIVVVVSVTSSFKKEIERDRTVHFDRRKQIASELEKIEQQNTQLDRKKAALAIQSDRLKALLHT